MTAGVADERILTLRDVAATLARRSPRREGAMRPGRDDRRDNDARAAAGNGLLDRRGFFKGGGAAAGGLLAVAPRASGGPPPPPPPGDAEARGPLSPTGAP